MQKYLLLSLLIVSLSACTIGGKSNNGWFTDLYNESVHSMVESIDEFGTLIGINRHESIEGSLSTSLVVPGILSGSLTSQYSGLLDGRNSESFFRDFRVLFTSLVSSGSLSADEIGFLSHGTDSYLSYKNITDTGLMTDEMRTIVKKYQNTWLSLIDNSEEDMSENELMAYNFTQNVMKKSLSDVEKYLTDYPLFKETADLGMSGSLHFWSVDLDRANIVALSRKLAIDLTGTGIADADIATLTTNLDAISFSGKIWFDPSNPKVSTLDGTVSLSGVTLAGVTIARTENGWSLRLTNPMEKITLEMNYGKADNRYTFDGKVSQDGIDMGELTGYIEHIDGKFRELALQISAQGMTVSLKHTLTGDKFVGKLSAAILGTLDWSGDIGDGRLKSLLVSGTAPFGSISVDLKEIAGNMVQWPILIKSGTDTILNATLALAVMKERFAIILDVISESIPVHFDLDITAKSTPSDKKIDTPKSKSSLQSLMNEIEALTPVQSPFIDTDTSGSVEPTGFAIPQ